MAEAVDHFTPGDVGKIGCRDLFARYIHGMTDHANGELRGGCPFCNKGRWTGNRRTGHWRCADCGARGEATDFLRRIRERKITRPIAPPAKGNVGPTQEKLPPSFTTDPVLKARETSVDFQARMLRESEARMRTLQPLVEADAMVSPDGTESEECIKNLHPRVAVDAQKRTQDTKSDQRATSTDWPKPGELPRGLLPVPVIQPVMIPKPFRAWLTDIADRLQCPLEFPATGAIAVFAGVVGRRIGIRPKQQDDWVVVPNLWGGVIGRPGILKTPALAEVMKPLQRLEVVARAVYEEEQKQFELTKMVRKAQKEELERKIREAVKKGGSPDSVVTTFSLAPEAEEPLPVRYIVNDATVEKLGELLNQNPHGLFLFRDELTGWLRTLDRDGHENDRAFYLEAWSGNGSYTYDRIGRGTLYVKAACVSIFGGIQPGPLAEYLRAAVRGGSGDDGLMQRFQLLVYPDDPGGWQNIDRWPNTVAKDQAFKIFESIPALDLKKIGAEVPSEDDIPFLRFAPDAQGLFDEWRGDLERKLRSRDEHPVLEAHLSKYRSLMPSLALLFHLMDVANGNSAGAVSKDATTRAAGWCDFLELHARRIYQGVTQQTLFSARQLATRIREGKLSSPFTARHVYNNGWMGLSTPEDVERAAELLEDICWLRLEKKTTGGRPRLDYRINPHLSGQGGAS